MSYLLLEHAVGSIQAGKDQQERLDEITERLSGDEFFVETIDTIPSACIDGRIGGSTRPNAAGGTNSLVVSEDLTNDLDVGYMESFSIVSARLLKNMLPIGGHDDENANDLKCGCGACDRLADIYQFIAKHGDIVRAVVENLGVKISDELHQMITENAELRHDFPSGPKLIDEMKSGTLDHLLGEHKEVVTSINTKSGTTLDREKLAAEFGKNYEAFNIDVWSFEAAAHAVSRSESEIQEKISAMLYYNVATAHVLCGSSMRVIIR